MKTRSSSEKYLALFLLLLNISLNMKAQVYHKEEITPELLDSLSKYPQGTLESDLYYQLVLEKYPNTQEAYMGRSVSYNKRGEHARGFQLLNKAVELNPLQNLGYRAFVKLYMMHDYKGALTDVLQLDTLSGKSKPAVWGEDMDMFIGLCFLLLENTQDAKLYLNKSINRISEQYGKQWNFARSFMYLGITLYKEKNYPEALVAFTSMAEAYPNSTEAYYYQAACHKEQNNISEMQKQAQQALECYKKQGTEKNPYFEMPFQVYYSMITDLLKQ